MVPTITVLITLLLVTQPVINLLNNSFRVNKKPQLLLGLFYVCGISLTVKELCIDLPDFLV
jgi:hypothetical protein